MVRNAPMRKEVIKKELTKKYDETDIDHVIKHSKGMYCGINGLVSYREWVQVEEEMDVGV